MTFNVNQFILLFSLGLLSGGFLLFLSTALRFPEKKYQSVLFITTVSLFYNISEIIVVYFSSKGFFTGSLIADYVQQLVRIGYFVGIPFFIDSYIDVSPAYARFNRKVFLVCKLIAAVLLFSALFLPELYADSLRQIRDSSISTGRGNQGIIYIISEAIIFPLILYMAWTSAASVASVRKDKRSKDMITLMLGIFISIVFFSSAISKSLFGSYFPPFNNIVYSRTNTGLMIFSVCIIWVIFRRFLTRAREAEITQKQLQISEKKLYSMVYIDKLTGLSNRHAFFRDARELKKTGSLKGASLMLVNINSFRDINESYGSTEGDEILSEIANIFISRINQRLSVYRFGGDEFAFFNPFSESEQNCIEYTLNIQKWIAEAIIFDKNVYSLDSTAGLFRCIDDSIEVDDMVKNCSSALRKAKQDKSGLTVFNTNLENESVNRIRMVMDLKEGIRNSEFYLMYQPIVNNEAVIVSLEALIRWNHASGHARPPSEFIPVAETAGLMPELGELILELFIRDHLLIREFLPDAVISLNISPAQLFSNGLFEFIRDSFKYHEVDTGKIQLEVTETTFISNYNRVLTMMNQFRSLGILVALDDFGTGYSSLQHLQKMPVDVIKIDKSFLDDLSESKQAVSIVKTIIDLSNALQLKTIAEGVESVEQYEILKSLGCGFYQGFYFHKPLIIRDLKKISSSKF
jgi:diguanylate cyclase (GGDEF)-like protein